MIKVRGALALINLILNEVYTSKQSAEDTS